MKKIVLFAFSILLFTIGLQVKAVTLNEVLDFNVDKSYDVSDRADIKATLVDITPKIYFYIDKIWWDQKSDLERSMLLQDLDNLSAEFVNKIYPTLTSTFGSEWKPGIDNDERITVLFHQMKEGSAGYFRSSDEYLKIQLPDSNEREMLYLSTSVIDNPQLKAFLSHEFIHLITFNQKERAFGATEDVWLNEARAEYAPTLLGYDSDFQNSNIRRRIKNFMDSKSDSLTEWRGAPYDYGVANLFTQYLVDQYGVSLLEDSLKSRKTGIDSINEALKKNGYSETFSEVFTNWEIAIYVNDCSLGPKYCYKNENLKNFKVTPTTNFLPLSGDSTLSINYRIKDWAGDWLRFSGGRGILTVDFNGYAKNFTIPYLIDDSSGKQSLRFLSLDNLGKGEIKVLDFGSKAFSITLLPSSQNKFSDFTDSEPFYSFSLTVATEDPGQVIVTPTPTPVPTSIPDTANIQQLKERIRELQNQIINLLMKLIQIYQQKIEAVA